MRMTMWLFVRMMKTEEVLPNDEEVLPNDEEVLPNDEEVLPNDEEALPNDEEVLPNDEEVLPNDEEVLPGGRIITPSNYRPLSSTQACVITIPTLHCCNACQCTAVFYRLTRICVALGPWGVFSPFYGCFE